MIRRGGINDLSTLATLANELWPNQTVEAFQSEMVDEIKKEEVAFFLAFKDCHPIAFAQCQLRHDYVEGTKTSPVGYLEGVYVRDNYRKQGIAKNLLIACQNWAKEKHCQAFASDCELENTASLHFHLATGFIEANRIICFTKTL